MFRKVVPGDSKSAAFSYTKDVYLINPKLLTNIL